MKKLLFLIIMISWAFSSFAQLPKMPSWVNNRPVPSNDTFYYRVTKGEGAIYDKAYANAFAKAILESSWKLGVEVKNSDDLKTLEDGIYDNITLNEKQMNLPMNKVCEYVEPLKGKTGVQMYILWQVASYGNVKPIFDDFNSCE